MQYNKLYQTDQKNKNPNTEIYLRRLNQQIITKKSLSTQKSFSKIVERKLLKPKINDENKDSSNFLEVTNSKISTVKFQKTSTNNKSAIPTHLKIKENLQNDKGFQELMKAYNDPKMKTKTLPDYFDIECLKDFDLSLEKIDKKANMNNLCIKSIGDFTIIKQKMETNDHNMPLNLKNEINIQNLEKFFNKKNDKKQELGSPTNNLRKFEERVKVNSNYEKEKKKITVNQPPIRNNWIAAPYKSHSALRECHYNLNEAQTSLLYFAKINDFEKCLKIMALRDFLHQKPNLINFKGNNDWSCLHYSSLNGNIKLVELLLSNEAIIDAETSSKLTPLMIACQKGHEEITQILINAGAEINLFDLSGNTAIHYGVTHGQKRIVEFLLNRPSINLRIRNNDKKTAKEESLINPEIFHLFENYFQTSKTHPKITNKIVIHNANPVAISNLLGKHYQRFNAKIQENFFDNVSNIQTTATYSSNSNTINDFSFLGGVTDDESYQDNENLKEKITLDSFNIKGLIGKGSFGEVFLVEKKNSNIMYAMKVLKKSLIMKNNLVKYALTERNVLSLTNNPFIVKLLYAFQTNESLFLIMEYCPGGDLGQHLQREKKFSEERTRIYIAEIILALEDLHKRDIIFRDLKPDNIVLDKDGHALLTDFGLSKEGILDPNQGARSFCGSLAYLAPEMLKRCGHGKAVDWYLLGVVMYEMLVGTPPFYTNNKEELFMNIENAVLRFPKNMSQNAKSLLKSLLQRNPTKRLGSGKGDAEEVKCNAFFKGINWNDVEKKKLKPPLPEITNKFNAGIKGESLKTQYKNEDVNENNYISGWSFVSHNKKL